jgi:2-polyprenyl-6-methoxyphenol hydroxylase-like FAD-dependent oxidoreductase
MGMLIIGAGIAGTTAALALRKAGVAVKVYEAGEAATQDEGAFLTLAPNGMRALAELGAADRVAAAGFPLTSMRITDLSGAVLGERALDGFHYVRRGDCCEALRRECADRGIGITYGKRLLSLSGNGSAVFTGGEEHTAELIVGADGLNSVLRGQIHDAVPRYAGQVVYYGYCATNPAAASPHTFELVKHTTSTFGLLVTPAGRSWWFARLRRPALGDRTSLRDNVLRAFDRNSTAARVVAATTTVLATDARDLPLGVPWTGRGALLVGDAAHGASPSTGQGASMAFEDAVVLGKALRDNGIADGVRIYERLRRPRTEHNIAASATLTAPGGPPPPTEPAPTEEQLAVQLRW